MLNLGIPKTWSFRKTLWISGASNRDSASGASWFTLTLWYLNKSSSKCKSHLFPSFPNVSVILKRCFRVLQSSQTVHLASSVMDVWVTHSVAHWDGPLGAVVSSPFLGAKLLTTNQFVLQSLPTFHGTEHTALKKHMSMCSRCCFKYLREC